MVSVLSLVTTPIRPATAMPAAMICSAIAASIVAPHAVARAMTPSHVERSVSRLIMYLNMPLGACQNNLENLLLSCYNSFRGVQMKIFNIITAVASTAGAFLSMRIACSLRKETERTPSVVIYNNSQPKEEKAQSDENLQIEREDYYKNLDRRDNERFFTEKRLGDDLMSFLKFLITFQSIGVGALLYKGNLNDSTALSLFLLILSFICIAISYRISLNALAKWSSELAQIDKKYEELQYPSNKSQHRCIRLGVIFLVLAILTPVCNFYMGNTNNQGAQKPNGGGGLLKEAHVPSKPQTAKPPRPQK